MNYKIKKFSELTTKELYEILKVRVEVFVVEQNCIYQDLDSKDEVSFHVFLEDNSEIIAYLRVLPKGISYPETSIGRVLTKNPYRKKGLSKEIVQKAIDFIIDTLEEKEIKISAQAYLQKFYESFGFKSTSDIYLEDGIEHIEMLYQK
ncbi:GNAT family N-acetyltransferase [Tissierella pigra]|uniref:GNAT family N-acetyltransferase n=1 Tax=Tissierella pigra TaxID=2607614 RepID=A0A6N7XKC9_9FIRM|nr:GNAT family N-acetyltransferase [Tissierella pigra]MBU5426257.1 GNAT family N-acetyltransferase [Tissierella pigra]MSU01242.1 GNAT family N-acetyltransferase [Tissierella pigra]